MVEVKARKWEFGQRNSYSTVARAASGSRGANADELVVTRGGGRGRGIFQSRRAFTRSGHVADGIFPLIILDAHRSSDAIIIVQYVYCSYCEVGSLAVNSPLQQCVDGEEHMPIYCTAGSYNLYRYHISHKTLGIASSLAAVEPEAVATRFS